MKKPFLFALVTAVCLSLTLPPSLSLAQDAEEESTGKKIGKIFNDIITEAVPGLNTFLDLVWPNRKNKDAVKKDEEVVNAKELKAVTDKLNTDLLEKQQDLNDYRASILTKLASLEVVATDLSIINRFLQPSLVAHDKIIPIRRTLFSKPQISDAEWASIAASWNEEDGAKKSLEKLDKLDFDGLTDKSLRIPLKNIQKASSETRGLISTGIANKDRTALLLLVRDLESRLREPAAAVGLLLGDLTKSLAMAANTAKAKQGDSPSETLILEQDALISFYKGRLSSKDES